MKIPKIVWFGAAAAVLGYVIYRAVQGIDDARGRADAPPVVDRGLRVTRDENGYWDVIDIERTFVVARIAPTGAGHLRFEIDGEFYVMYVDGLESQRWSRGIYIPKPPRVPR